MQRIRTHGGILRAVLFLLSYDFYTTNVKTLERGHQ